MRALTLYRPWAWSIIHGPKRLENRPWKPWPVVVGQEIAIHAGARWDRDGELYILKALGLERLPAAAKDQGLIGTARVLGHIETADAAPADQRVWFFGPFAWLLADVTPFLTPVPCKGALGLWKSPLITATAVGHG